MQVTIVGSGYVGLVAGACFAQMGNAATCLDVDASKIERLKKGEIPIYEPGLESMVKDNVALHTLSFTTDKKVALESAEMTKYAANAMLATKISFINEMSQICERVGANINDVRLGIGSDSRIGYSFIYPGCGYGGSCFPKDVRALEKTAQDYGYKARILEAVQVVNDEQKMLLVQKIVRHFGEDLSHKTFGVWGLSFKPETDDMREASSLVLVRELLVRGATIKAYDPKAAKQAEFYFKDNFASVQLESSKYDALKNCEALVLLTEWREFRSPDFEEMKKLLKNPIIFDGRNIYQHFGLQAKGFIYYQIGVKYKSGEF
ncbi:MAG: UDP-glucose/GDP-mannose dehydrogenase family protein [Helicobacter sp.]|uniref:UDP-glucose dehydrogenase family protein n=1 Tax=Helicobacter sp. TaxID=218 RepID=UPI0025B7B2D7|nr:nucleotide sugar dehydrogenase [Helicobacter sp.]MCH5313696.1 UDP-glucose/GDP-mannose dehydrogenase family protein [Helicobacter sp.]